jgi:subtilisin family serine protease
MISALPPSKNDERDGRPPGEVKPVELPVQREKPFLPELAGASRLVRIAEARNLFKVDGRGTTVAVLDSGLRTTHRDFAGRVRGQRNFTGGNGGDPDDASDGHGHGTSLAGMICAGGVHRGVAPGAAIVPVKVLDDDGAGRFAAVAAGLQWVIDNCGPLEISAACLAFGDGGNHPSDSGLCEQSIASRIRTLADLGVACCVAAGDDYFTHGSVQGMSYPAIVRDALSVGAVFEGDVGPAAHSSGAEAFETRADRITPFSQRLHAKLGRECATTILAPGGAMVSSGILSDSGSSLQHGTSRATPLVAGVVLLLQSLHKRAMGSLPPVAELRRWLLDGAVAVVDVDDEHDNVLHTGLPFPRLDAVGALDSCARDIARKALSARPDSREATDLFR